MGVGMRMAVTVAVIMRVRVTVTVAVVITEDMMAFDQRALVAVGAAFGLKGSRHVMHVGAKADDHLLKHVIGLNVEGIGRDLAGGVTVADVPGDAGEFGCAMGMDLKQRLRRCDDLQMGAVVQEEAITVGEVRRFRQVEQNLVAAIGRERDAATVARGAIESERVDGDLAGHVGAADGGSGAKHGRAEVRW